jgi:hypothetical protein
MVIVVRDIQQTLTFAWATDQARRSLGNGWFGRGGGRVIAQEILIVAQHTRRPI